MDNRITIKTALDDGIYASSGGGQTTVQYDWAIGPRGLIAALDTLPAHRRDMIAGYGSVGHSGSWIEVAGVRVSHWDIEEYLHETKDLRSVSRTAWCRQYIASVLDGSLVATRRADAKRELQARAAYDAGLDAGHAGESMPISAAGYDYETERGYRDGCLDRAELDRAEAEQDRGSLA